MEEKKLKRRRRKKQSPKNMKKHRNIHKEMAMISRTEAEVVEDIPTYDVDAVNRINAVPNLRDIMKPDALTNLIGKYGHMTPVELMEKAKDPDTTCFERMQMERMALATTPKTKLAIATAESIIQSIEGKPTARHEHTGPNGGPITLAAGKAKDENDWEKVVENMTAEEFEEYKATVSFNQRMKNKYANNNGK